MASSPVVASLKFAGDLLRGVRSGRASAAIPCRVLDGDGMDGAEASLAENVVVWTCARPISSRRSPA